MAKEIKTFEERKKTLLEKGKQKGFITYEELADELRGLDVDSDSLDDLYNTLVDPLEQAKIAEKIRKLKMGS